MASQNSAYGTNGNPWRKVAGQRNKQSIGDTLERTQQFLLKEQENICI